jgi:hypothetical protein
LHIEDTTFCLGEKSRSDTLTSLRSIDSYPIEIITAYRTIDLTEASIADSLVILISEDEMITTRLLSLMESFFY